MLLLAFLLKLFIGYILTKKFTDCTNFLLYFFTKKLYNIFYILLKTLVARDDGTEVYMANFKKFLAFTVVTAAAAAGGVFLYKKLQENKLIGDQEDDDFDDFEDDFDDDFDDFESDNRSYTAIVGESEATEIAEESASESSESVAE